jgi:hypothetical protein
MQADNEKLTAVGLLLLLVEKSPRCACGGNCETLQYMAEMFREMQVKQAGWQV